MKRATLFAVVCCGFASFAFAEQLPPLDSNVMLRGYCSAGSRADPQALGGYGTSDNHPRRLKDTGIGQNGALRLVALPTDIAPFGQSHAGFRVLLVNRTPSEVALPASDSRVSIIQEALDAKGRWRAIEYLPESWCGNSDHRVFLPPNHYWEFVAPQYVGTRKTKLRFVLLGERPIYSTEFEGSINPQQLTTKQGHTPTSIMDPYTE